MKQDFVDQPCSRCGSKKIIAKTWMEKVPTFSGKDTLVEYSQIVCTNEACQKAFEENLEKETKKKEAIQLERSKKEQERKDTAHAKAEEFLKTKLQ